MGSPFEPRSYRERPAKSEYPADAPPMMLRLIRAGLTQAEREEVREAWAAMTDAERAETAEMYENIDDDELARQLEESRAEDAVGRGAVAWDAADPVEIHPEDVPDGPVPAVLAWVGEDRQRAKVALIAEGRRHDPPRKTLVDPLESLAGG